jgi:hypothetical protein
MSAWAGKAGKTMICVCLRENKPGFTNQPVKQRNGAMEVCPSEFPGPGGVFASAATFNYQGIFVPPEHL